MENNRKRKKVGGPYAKCGGVLYHRRKVLEDQGRECIQKQVILLLTAELDKYHDQRVCLK